MSARGLSLRLSGLDYRGRAMGAALAAGATVIGLLAGLFLLIAGWSFETSREIGEARAVAAGSSQMVAQRQQIAGVGTQLFAGATHVDAVAAMHGAVRALADRHRGVVSSVAVLPAARRGSLTLLVLRCGILIPEAELPAFLASIAAHAPTLGIEGLEIVPARQGGTTGAPARIGGPDARLLLTIDLAGFSRSPLPEGGRP